MGLLTNSFGENKQQANFKIDGVINADSGKIHLFFFPDFIPNLTKELITEVKGGKFSIAGYIPECQSVFISFEDSYISSNFVIEEGVQTVFINVDSVREVPMVHNNTMLEEYPNYMAFRENIEVRNKLFDQKRDSIQKIYNHNLPSSVSLILDEEMKALYNASDSTLLKYTEKNPNSEIAFWNLIRLMDWGYEPIFDSIYDAFSEKLRDGYAGKILSTKLQNSRSLSIGQKFPSFKCLDTTEKNLSSHIFLKNKFTLVDFWYSRCAPCRRQFSRMRDLYKQYSSKGFEIVGISIDQIKDKKEWEEVIVKEKLVWKQYWDKNGIESQRFSIRAFPTNFLIDNTGKIINKNISMEELDRLLSSQTF